MRLQPDKPLVFIVDDVPENIQIALSHLKGLDLEFAYATSGEQALARISNRLPDLILLDVMMPGMNGFATMREIRKAASMRSVPVIFLTARSEPEDVAKGFELGGVDYITKPFHGVELRSRVRNHLELHSYRVNLEEKVQARTREIILLKDITIVAMGELAEHRDASTGGHIHRTLFFVKALAEALLEMRKFQGILTREYIALLYKTAPLHDIGKVAIRDSILLKEGRLTAEEFTEMKKHTIYGEEVIDKLAKMAGKPMAFLECAKDMVGSHHEKYDGTGYPRGLAGDNIPLAGRIMAAADVYDALRTKRSYKKAFSHAETMRIMEIEDGRGRHFDPDVYDALLRVEQRFEAIAEENDEGLE